MVGMLEGVLVAPEHTRPEVERSARRVPTRRVLHLINGEVFSGAERVQQLLGKRLGSAGYDPFFACLKPGKFAECCELPSHRIWNEPMQHRRDFGVVARLAQRANDAGVHLLHAHTPRTAMIASLVARKLHLPWVYHVHSPTARDSTRWLQNFVNDCVERLSLLNADRVITVSKSLRREMLRRGWDRHRVVSIANGVAEQEPIFPIERISQNDWRLGMVALIRPRKGIEVLLHAMQHVRSRFPNVSLDIVGGFETPDYEAHVRKLADSLELKTGVTWRGFTRDVQSALRSMDAMVLPSLFGEGMPMVVLEALAVGVPVIATRVEGTPEVVRDGREGYLAEPGDAQSLADTIIKMIRDRHTWCQMSECAFQRHRESFSDTRMAQHLALTYDRLLAETANRYVPARLPNQPRVAPHARRFRSFLAEA